jgi:hypothetical protein
MRLRMLIAITDAQKKSLLLMIADGQYILHDTEVESTRDLVRREKDDTYLPNHLVVIVSGTN